VLELQYDDTVPIHGADGHRDESPGRTDGTIVVQYNPLFRGSYPQASLRLSSDFHRNVIQKWQTCKR
jgi:hypothetical protein